MADEKVGTQVPLKVSLKKDDIPPVGAAVPIRSRNHQEETAAEIAAPVPLFREKQTDENKEQAAGGAGLGTIALALSLISLFVWPILFGAAGIILGFVAKRRGAAGLGAWAIGIGVVSIIVGIFILPFF